MEEEGKGMDRGSEEGRRDAGRGGLPHNWVTLDHAVQDGREGIRTSRGAWVEASRHFLLHFKHLSHCELGVIV